MKSFLRPFCVAFLCTLSRLVAADAPKTPAGYWEGSVALPNMELKIAIELASGSGGTWQGTIDIPMQGMRGFKLDPVKVEGNAVELGLPGVPGDPLFQGKMAPDGKTIVGDFLQGGGQLSFQLERKTTKPAPEPRAEIPARGVPGKGLVGKWRGAIMPQPNIELRGALEVTAGAAGKLEAVFISLDQGNKSIPVQELTEKAGKVHFETPEVEGEFNGQLSADGAEISGDWSQRGLNLPLVLKRLPSAAP